MVSTRGAWVLRLCLIGIATAQGQTNPPAQGLPYVLDFGVGAFSTVPAGLAVWAGLNGATINSLSQAAASTPTQDGSVGSATSVQTTGGVYGFATGGNARLYIQTSSNSTSGACQFAIAVNTTARSSVSLSYDIEMISPQARTVGIVCQYRLGTSGVWSTLTASSGPNPFSGSTGPAGPVQITLPANAADRPVVQIRWATWRGTESGNSSGLAIDNISVTGAIAGNSLTVALNPASIAENAGTAATTATVTAASPVAADLPVTLSVSDLTEAAIDSANPVVIPAGGSTATFTIGAVDDDGLDGPQSVVVQASAPGTIAGTATLTVTDNEDALSPPAGFYAAAGNLSGASLKAALRIIAATGHRAYDYADTFNPLRAIHADPANSANVLTVYSGTSVPRNDVYRPDAGLDPNLTWSREHLWPVSFGIDPEGVNPGSTGGDAGRDYTDLFNLRPAINSVNSLRSNRIFDETGTSPSIPALAPLCSYDSDSWEPRATEKGDIARAMFYMAVRYDGTDALTLDLELANSPSTGAGRFAKLSTLLRWHDQDPVSLTERQQNQLIYSTYQKNRNPFVDHPEYVDRLWGTIHLDKSLAAVGEGGSGDAYTIILTSQPQADVTLQIAMAPAGYLTVNPSSITFTTSNWNVPRNINLSAPEDTIYEATTVVTLTHQVTTTDPYYATISPGAVLVTVADNDPLIAGASLPFQFGGPWSPLPTTGFLGEGLGSPYATSLGGDTATGSAKFDSSGDRLTIAFTAAPGVLSYRLKGNPASGTNTVGFFDVLQSADGESFSLLRTVIDAPNTDQAYSDVLASSSRYVAFFYRTKTAGNIQVDQVTITTASGHWDLWLDSYNLTGASRNPALDLDFDGLAALAEYALGRSPIAPDPAVPPPLWEKVPGFLRVTAVIRTGGAHLTVTVETTTDLTQPSSWTTAGVTRSLSTDQSNVPGGFERTVFAIADDGVAARFGRIVFELR